jgi:hypothetical protein
MSDRDAPWILAAVIGFVAWKPYGFTTVGIATFAAGALIGFAAGIPFWWRGRRHRRKSA